MKADPAAPARNGPRASRAPTSPLQAPQRQRLCEQLATQLINFIEVSRLEVGDRLPSERDLAGALQVSRASLRQATISLEVQGILEVRHGGGIYLKTHTSEAAAVAELMVRQHRLPAILEAREALESRLATLAASRRTDDDLRAMEHALGLMSLDIDNGGLGLDGDELFHAAITRSARSPLLADLMASLAPAIAETRIASLAEPGRPLRSLAAHQRIAKAIRTGDPAAARLAMLRHLRMVADIRLLRWSTRAINKQGDPVADGPPPDLVEAVRHGRRTVAPSFAFG